MTQKPDPFEYAKLLGNLFGDDFQDEIILRVRRVAADLQRVPDKPSGDGGLDGLSHGQTRAYCCYGPEHDPVKLKATGLKDDIVDKFRSDLRRILEVTFGPGNRIIHDENKALSSIIGEGNKIETIILIVNWFETHRIIGPINTAFKRYLKGSRRNYVADNATVVIWGPKDVAELAAVDEHTLFRIEHRRLLERVQAATAADIPAAATGDFDAKFTYPLRPPCRIHIFLACIPEPRIVPA